MSFLRLSLVLSLALTLGVAACGRPLPAPNETDILFSIRVVGKGTVLLYSAGEQHATCKADSTCPDNFAGDLVSVVAEPAPGWHFVGWSGGGSALGTAATLDVKIDATSPIKEITATFAPDVVDKGDTMSAPDQTTGDIATQDSGSDAATTADAQPDVATQDASKCNAPGQSCSDSNCCTGGAFCVGSVADQKFCTFSGAPAGAPFCLPARVGVYGGCGASVPCCDDSSCPGPSATCCVAKDGFCDVDRLCCKGFKCDAGTNRCIEACAPVGSIPLKSNPVPCCPGGALEAASGMCVPTTPKYAPCGASTETHNICTPGLECNYVMCLPPSGKCDDLGNCPNGATCSGNDCLPPGPACSNKGEGCAVGQPCCGSLTCTDSQSGGVCVDVLGAACTAGVECASGSCDPATQKCCRLPAAKFSNGTILPSAACKTDADCCGSALNPPQAVCKGFCCLPQGHACPNANDYCCNGACLTNGQCP